MLTTNLNSLIFELTFFFYITYLNTINTFNKFKLQICVKDSPICESNVNSSTIECVCELDFEGWPLLQNLLIHGKYHFIKCIFYIVQKKTLWLLYVVVFSRNEMNEFFFFFF